MMQFVIYRVSLNNFYTAIGSETHLFNALLTSVKFYFSFAVGPVLMLCEMTTGIFPPPDILIYIG